MREWIWKSLFLFLFFYNPSRTAHFFPVVRGWGSLLEFCLVGCNSRVLVPNKPCQMVSRMLNLCCAHLLNLSWFVWISFYFYLLVFWSVDTTCSNCGEFSDAALVIKSPSCREFEVMLNRFAHAGTELFLGVTNFLKAFIRAWLPFNAIRHTAYPVYTLTRRQLQMTAHVNDILHFSTKCLAHEKKKWDSQLPLQKSRKKKSRCSISWWDVLIEEASAWVIQEECVKAACYCWTLLGKKVY